MATDYVQEIRKYDHTALQKLWQQVQDRNTPRKWKEGMAFEYLLLRAFELEGADIVWPYEVKLEGNVVEQIDGVIYSDNVSYLVEAKDHRDHIDFAPIAKLHNQLLRRPASVMGIVFSKHGFTEPAKILSRYTAPQRILLWEGEEISIALEKQQMRVGLKVKYRYAVERGLPDLHLEEIL